MATLRQKRAMRLQASMAPPGVRAAQAARRVALRQQEPDAAERAEVALLVALLGAQFGPAQADLANDTISLQVRAPSWRPGAGQCGLTSLLPAAMMCAPVAMPMSQMRTSAREQH